MDQVVSIIGLGYVGLPLALEFAKHFKVIGFDINVSRIELMKKGIDPSKELGSDAFVGCDIIFTSNVEDLKKAHFHIVGVPTDIDENKVPNLNPLLGASRSVASALKKGDYVVYESTVYPGCTEEDCVPILENISGLKGGTDFKFGYSPERIVPGDKVKTLTNILKIVSGNDEEALEVISDLYGTIIKAGLHKAESIKVAEAAKVIENSQRDINIAFVNELSKIFNVLGIDTHEVLKAAGTKWNFLPFKPGLVGGHCIGVDPYYLAQKAQAHGYLPEIILAGRKLNDSMGEFVASQLVKQMVKRKIDVQNSNVLVLGFTFKENCPDVRNTKVESVVRSLESFGVSVDIYDPHADKGEVKHEYDLEINNTMPSKKYDGLILAVAHTEYTALELSDYKKEQSVVYDIKGILPAGQYDIRL